MGGLASMASRSSRMQPNWTTVSAVWGPSSRSIAGRAVGGVVGSGSAVKPTRADDLRDRQLDECGAAGERRRRERRRTSLVVVIVCFLALFCPRRGRVYVLCCWAVLGTSRLTQPQRCTMFEQQCTGALRDVCSLMLVSRVLVDAP